MEGPPIRRFPAGNRVTGLELRVAGKKLGGESGGSRELSSGGYLTGLVQKQQHCRCQKRPRWDHGITFFVEL